MCGAEAHMQTRTHTCAYTEHRTSLMLQNPNPSSQLPENMTWPFRFTEHQARAGLACFPSHRTPCLFRPPCNPQGPRLTTNNYSPSSTFSARHGQKNLTLHLTRACAHTLKTNYSVYNIDRVGHYSTFFKIFLNVIIMTVLLNITRFYKHMFLSYSSMFTS